MRELLPQPKQKTEAQKLKESVQRKAAEKEEKERQAERDVNREAAEKILQETLAAIAARKVERKRN